MRGLMVLVSETIQLLMTLAGLPGVKSVNAVRAQGKVKHFCVTYLLDMAECDGCLDALANAWSFGTVETDKQTGKVKAEYLVRPEEVISFASAIEAVNIPMAEKRNAVLYLEFDRLVGKKVQDAFRSILRSEDSIHWRGAQVKIVLTNCKDLTRVEDRLRELARKYGLQVLDVEAAAVS